MTGGDADRELLTEALAVHLGLVPRRAPDGPSAGPPPLAAEQSAVLDRLVAGLIERHGDARRSLDALAAFGRLRAELERRRAGTDRGDPSHNPTLPSIPIKGDPAAPALDALEDDDSFLPDGAGPIEPRRVDWSVGAPTSLGARFRILRPHARGGIGEVSVAFDAELQREVALKQIKPERAEDPDSRARFLLEAEVTGRLEHPGIVPVYGLGLDADGRPFYAMRLVRGTSLDAAINAFHGADKDPRRDPQERSLALRYLLDRFADVCQTVAYAHSRGVLHRDLKPANILLGPFNESLVVDWGLAKVMAGERGRPPDRQGEAPAEPRFPPGPANRRDADGADPGGSSEPPLGSSSSVDTVAGSTFGTPAYMSPEQADGRLDRMGPASDVYSLGAMLYTLTTGRPPFEYLWCDMTAMLDRVRLGEFPRPRKVNPRVPRALEAICLKAMANRPEDRYASATELAEEVGRWLADEPVRADREPAAARLARWGRRHRPAVAVAGAMLLTAVAALSAGLLLLGREQRRTEQHRRRAEMQAESLRRRDAISRVNLAYREYLDDNVALGDEQLDGCPRDLRAWEWSYARRLGHAELSSWTPSSTGLDVWSVAFSPDGARIAAGTGPWGIAGDGPTGELAVREVHSGAEVLAIRGLRGAVQAVAYSPDGRAIAAAHGFTGPESGAVLLMLDAGSGREVWRADERGVQVLALAFAPDGRTIAAGCGKLNDYESSGFVRLRDARTGAAIGGAIAGPSGGVLAVAFAPDGNTLAMTGRDVVDLRDVRDPRRPLVRRLGGHVNFVYAVTFSPDGRRLASAGWDQTIRVRDRPTGRAAETFHGHRGFVRGLAFAPDGRQLVSCSEDRSVRRWDLDDGEPGATFHGHTGFVHCVAFGPDGVTTASGSQDGTVKIWPAAAPDAQVTFRNSAGWVGAVAFAPDGRAIATAHYGNVRIWDSRTGEERHRIMAHRAMMGNIALAFSPDGTTLAVTGPGGEVHLWEAANWTRLSVLGGAPGIKDAAFSPDGARLATVGEDGALRLWDVARRELIRRCDGHEGSDDAVAYSPDGRAIATAGSDKIVRIWDGPTGDLIAALSGHEHGVRDVAFSPDGRHLAAVGGAYRGAEPDEIRIWDWMTRREVRSLHGHTGLVHAVAYFPGGRRLATASDDRTIKLWDPTTGENVLTLRGHTSGVVGLSVSRDGAQLASGSIDYSARVWSIEAHEGEAAFELSLRRAAVERVQALYARHLLKEDVLAELRRDAGLRPRLREAALEIAARRTENASRLYEAAWLTVARPVGSPEENRLALRRLEAACRVAAEDPGRLDEYRRALALASYRVGRPAEALEVLAEPARRAPSPVDLAVRAMANHRLGRAEEARRALDQLRTLVASGRFANDRDAAGFLEEAEQTLGTRPDREPSPDPGPDHVMLPE